jgi:hypothetical protein
MAHDGNSLMRRGTAGGPRKGDMKLATVDVSAEGRREYK